MMTAPEEKEEDAEDAVDEGADVIAATEDDGEEPETSAAEDEGTAVLVAELSETIDAVSGPMGTSVGPLRVVVASGGVVVVVTVPLLCLFPSFAIFNIPVATPGSSLCMASKAVRSSGNIP